MVSLKQLIPVLDVGNVKPASIRLCVNYVICACLGSNPFDTSVSGRDREYESVVGVTFHSQTLQPDSSQGQI